MELHLIMQKSLQLHYFIYKIEKERGFDMPFINSKTTVSVSEQQREQLKTQLGEAISLIPGKSERWLMLDLQDQHQMYFQGKSFEQIAFVEVKIFGTASDDVYNALTAKICQIYQTVLQIPSDKVYVAYQEIEHWGWNGSNF